MNATQRHAVAICRAVDEEDKDTAKAILNGLSRTEMRALVLELAGRAGPSDTEHERVGNALLVACRIFGTNVEEVLSGSRRPEDVRARQVACYGAWLLGCSYSLIGRKLGRDHSSVMHAVARVGEDPRLREIATRVAVRLGWDRDLGTPLGSVS